MGKKKKSDKKAKKDFKEKKKPKKLVIDKSHLDPEVVKMVRTIFRDVREAVSTMGVDETRFLVDSYYQQQRRRTVAGSQIRSCLPDEETGKLGEPHAALDAFYELARISEDSLRTLLGDFALNYRVGQWLQSITGIGNVLSAAILVNFDIRRANTAGSFWRYAGMDPTVTWQKGQKRPWSANAKVLCFKAADCFIKFHNHKNDHYGQICIAYKNRQTELNESGAFADQAATILATKKFKDHDSTAFTCYSEGKLPPSHILSRARRWVGKLFLSHVHQMMHEDFHGKPAPTPYVFTEFCKGEHVHMLNPPNYELEFDGKPLADLYAAKPGKTGAA